MTENVFSQDSIFFPNHLWDRKREERPRTDITHDDIMAALQRHVGGDWGDVCAEDKLLNDRALVEGTRILSAYRATNGTKFWLITEANRSATTVLLPEEY